MLSNTCKKCAIETCESKRVLKRVRHHNIVNMPEVVFSYNSTLECCKLSKKQKAIRSAKNSSRINHSKVVEIS